MVASLSINNPIIGISFSRMNAAKRKVEKAQEEARCENESLSRAISSLHVSDGRLRMKAEALNSMRNKINSRQGNLQRIGTHIDYTVKRFEETDNSCAQRIKTNSYECRRALGLKTHGGIFGDIIGGIVSIVDKGKAAWHGIVKSVADFYEKHKVLINNIATIALEVVAVALTVAAIAAGAVTGVGLVLGVIGLAYSLSNIIDSGTKIFNYCTTGVEKGFNPLQEGFQAVLGEELGKKVYDYSNIALGVANIAVAGSGLIKAAKNAWKSGKTLKDIFKIGNKAVGKESQLIQSAANEEKAIAGAAESKINSFADLMEPEEAAKYNKYWTVKESTCTENDLNTYLKRLDPDRAEKYLETGKWPEHIQVPKNSNVLNADGSIKWSEVPNGGYVLDSSGNAIKEAYTPKVGEIIDRYGPSDGRYTSPVIDNKPYAYDQRSLPYVEEAAQYHQYEVTGDFSKINEYISNCSDIKLKAKIEAYITRYYNGDYSKLTAYKGDIAKGFGTNGGGTQYELQMPVEWLEKLGLLKEI